jgi:hypothetical protein
MRTCPKADGVIAGYSSVFPCVSLRSLVIGCYVRPVVRTWFIAIHQIWRTGRNAWIKQLMIQRDLQKKVGKNYRNDRIVKQWSHKVMIGKRKTDVVCLITGPNGTGKELLINSNKCNANFRSKWMCCDSFWIDRKDLWTRKRALQVRW